jgi:hypothetical protein
MFFVSTLKYVMIRTIMNMLDIRYKTTCRAKNEVFMTSGGDGR